MPHVTLNDLTMYYEEHGLADAPPLVLLHWFLGTGHFWEPQLPVFGERCRLIVPDLRGHGRSNNPGGLATMTYHQFARDIIALCRTLGIEHARFVGASAGAMLQLWLAVEAPTLPRSLVLSGGTYYYSDAVRAGMRNLTPERVISAEGPALMAQHTALGPEHGHILSEALIALADHEHLTDFPDPQRLRGLAMPVLIVHGDRDDFFPVTVPTELYRLLPHAELCILPHTGHGPSVERPEWFNPIVLDFLARRG
jgi:pimeloyl-ACP methyl ester carboxylesterase